VLPHGGAQIHFGGARVDREDVRIVGLVAILGEEELHVVVDARRGGRETAPALPGVRPLDVPAEVIAALAGGGEAPPDADRSRGTGIVLPPDGIVGREQTIDLRGLGFEGANVERQHSRVT
jgi:hypothetical protein